MLFQTLIAAVQHSQAPTAGVEKSIIGSVHELRLVAICATDKTFLFHHLRAVSVVLAMVPVVRMPVLGLTLFAAVGGIFALAADLKRCVFGFFHSALFT